MKDDIDQYYYCTACHEHGHKDETDYDGVDFIFLCPYCGSDELIDYSERHEGY